MEVFEGTSESAAAIKLSVVCNNNIKSSLYTASYYCNEGERHARGNVGTDGSHDRCFGCFAAGYHVVECFSLMRCNIYNRLDLTLGYYVYTYIIDLLTRAY